MCKRLHQIISQNPTLWRFFKFEDCLELNTDQLSYIVDHCSSAIRCFSIPYAIIHTPDLDVTLTSFLAHSQNIVTLDLTQSNICTQCIQHSIQLLTIVKIRQAECSEICSKNFKLLILKALLMFIKTLIILPASHVNYIARVKLPSAMSVYLGNTTFYMIQP